MQVTHANALGLQAVLRALGAQLLLKLCPVLLSLGEALGALDGSGVVDRRLGQRFVVLLLGDLPFRQ
ncbi:hypothetical protein D3C80_1611300 [compost metagenome]